MEESDSGALHWNYLYCGYNVYSSKELTINNSKFFIASLIFYIVIYVPFSVLCVLFVCKCVLYCCYRVYTQLRLIYHIISSYIISYHIIPYHIIYYISYHIIYYIIFHVSYHIVSYHIMLRIIYFISYMIYFIYYIISQKLRVSAIPSCTQTRVVINTTSLCPAVQRYWALTGRCHSTPR
jgi:hypothetical protein